MTKRTIQHRRSLLIAAWWCISGVGEPPFCRRRRRRVRDCLIRQYVSNIYCPMCPRCDCLVRSSLLKRAALVCKSQITINVTCFSRQSCECNLHVNLMRKCVVSIDDRPPSTSPAKSMWWPIERIIYRSAKRVWRAYFRCHTPHFIVDSTHIENLTKFGAANIPFHSQHWWIRHKFNVLQLDI